MSKPGEPLTSHPDDLRALRAFRAEDAAPDADARAAARVALLERIEAQEPAAASLAPASPRGGGRPRRRLLAGLGLASVAAVAAALVLAFGSGGVSPEPASAADALNRAAEAVAATEAPAPDLGGGRYWYVRSERYEALKPFGAGSPQGQVTYSLGDVRTRTERWTDSAGGGRTVLDVVGEPQLATPADREAWIAAGSPPLPGDTEWRDAPGVVAGAEGGTIPERRDGWLFWVGMSYEDLRALPADDDAALAATLERAAADRGAPVDRRGAFFLGANLVSSAPLSGAQRAAIYRVLAAIPGTELLGTVEDRMGRSGTGIAFTHDGGARVELIFDPATGTLLEIGRSGGVGGMLGEDWPEPDERETLLATGVVEGPDARP